MGLSFLATVANTRESIAWRSLTFRSLKKRHRAAFESNVARAVVAGALSARTT
jgi:hypothetical protein